jgi:hypothetical protein
MGRTRDGELSASNAAVLGLLIEQPDNTAGLEERLHERFVAAQWASTAAHSAIKSLLRQSYICPYDGEPVPARGDGATRRAGHASLGARPDLRALGLPGLGSAADRRDDPAEDGVVYHATPEGLIVFWRWLRKSSSIPMIRDELRTKIAFSRPEDLPRVIELIEGEEKECQANFNVLHSSLAEFDEHVDAEAFNSAENWWTLMLVALIRDEAAIWLSTMQRRERLREFMESLREESMRRSSEARQRGR